MENGDQLEFRLGIFGRIFPLLVAIALIIWAAVSQSNVTGYMTAFFAAVIVGVVFAKDEKAYGQAILAGLSKPMFPIISVAIILAAISGKLISGSGMIQTIAIYVVKAGFTGRLFTSATFLLTCLLAFSTGTSVGTYFVVIPILFPVGAMVGVEPVYMIGAIVSGAAFGDNLAPISDTTIASAGTQGADLGNVVKTRVKYSLPAAILALIAFLLFTRTTTAGTELESSAATANPLSLIMLLVPAAIIVLCLLRKHLITALAYGAIVGVVLGLISGIHPLNSLLAFPGGFSVTGAIPDAITGSMGTIAMLFGVFSLLGIMESSGLFASLGKGMGSFAKGPCSGEIAVIGSVGLMSMITGVISVAIVAMGDLVQEVGTKVGLDKYRRANLMDCAGCVFCFLAPWTVHCVIPAQQTAVFGEEFTVAPASVPFVNFYAIAMVIVLIVSVVTGYGRKNIIND